MECYTIIAIACIVDALEPNMESTDIKHKLKAIEDRLYTWYDRCRSVETQEEARNLMSKLYKARNEISLSSDPVSRALERLEYTGIDELIGKLS